MFLIHFIFLFSTIDMATVKFPCACFDKNPFIRLFVCHSLRLLIMVTEVAGDWKGLHGLTLLRQKKMLLPMSYFRIMATKQS